MKGKKDLKNPSRTFYYDFKLYAFYTLHSTLYIYKDTFQG